MVRDSIVFDGCRIERGAVVNRAILDKEVYVAKDCVVGNTDDYSPNRDRPELLSSGITIVGKRARIPAGVQIGRNCIIGPAVREDDFPSTWIASGETVRTKRPLGPFGV
jgi:glucose-1-phosphate adenylyltransferase